MTTLNNKPCSSRFGIQLDANTPLRPSFSGILLWLGLHVGACLVVWQLDWPYLLCLFVDVAILWLMVRTMDRYIFSIVRYQLSFFFDDKNGWMIQEDANTCYRAALRYAFCAKYLVILVFQNKVVLPIFFDSLPTAQFRQLRRVLILLNYV